MGLDYTIKHNGNTYGPISTGGSVSMTNGSVTNSITSAGTTTLSTKNKIAANNLVIGEKTLNCKDKVLTDDVTITTTTNPFGPGGSDLEISSAKYYNPSAVDTGVIEINCNNLTIKNGGSIIANNRNSGIIIRCTGNCTIESGGSIVNNLSPRSHSTNLSAYYPSWLISNGAGGTGGSGGKGGDGDGGAAGAGQGGRYYGGGYGGGGGAGWTRSYLNATSFYGYGGGGGSATGITTSTGLFVGGSGGNCNNSSWHSEGSVHLIGWEASGSSGSFGGGGGGGAVVYNAYYTGSHNAIGGAGNGNNGSASSDQYGDAAASGGGGKGNYGGGVVIIYCNGTFTNKGTINCNGSIGGNAGLTNTYGSCNLIYWRHSAPGGGGGGGRIYLMAKSISAGAVGTCSVSGGNAGYGGSKNETYAYGGATAGSSGNRYYITYANYNNGAGTPTSF